MCKFVRFPLFRWVTLRILCPLRWETHSIMHILWTNSFIHLQHPSSYFDCVMVLTKTCWDCAYHYKLYGPVRLSGCQFVTQHEVCAQGSRLHFCL